jgi:hypothetical protein
MREPCHVIKWFAPNNLILHVDKMNIMKFVTKNFSHSSLRIGYKETYIEEKVNRKFLGLQIDNHLNWKKNIESFIPNLSGTCYAGRSMVHISNINTLKLIYCVYVFSIYCKIWNNFLGNSFNSGEISTLQLPIVRMMAGAQPKTSCRSIF